MPCGCWVILGPFILAGLVAAAPFIGIYQVVKQTRLALRRRRLPPAPVRPPDYGLPSADGRWWWDGERWRPR